MRQAWKILRKLLWEVLKRIWQRSLVVGIGLSCFFQWMQLWILGKWSSLCFFAEENFGVAGFCLVQGARIFFLCFLTLWEIGTFLFWWRGCSKQRKTNIFSCLIESFGATCQVVRPANLWLIPFLLLVLPLSFWGSWSLGFLSWRIPDFLLQYGQETVIRQLLFGVVIGGMQILCIESLFLFHYLFLWQKPVLTAFHYSRNMGWWRLLPTTFTLFFWSMLWTVGGYFLYCISFLVLESVLRYVCFFFDWEQLGPLVLQGWEKCFLWLQTCLFVPVTIGIIDSCYQFFLQGDEGRVCAQWFSLRAKRWSTGVFVLLLVGSCYMSILCQPREMGMPFLRESPYIIAHRGYGKLVPPNTIAAVVAAGDIGVDCVEIDVQMTKDGQIVVFHDWNLSAVLGENSLVCQWEYGELSQAIAEKYRSVPQDQRPLPLLSQVLAAGDENLCWNIEIKPQYLWGKLKSVTKWMAVLSYPWQRDRDGNDWGKEEIWEDDRAKVVKEVINVLMQQGKVSQAMISSLDYAVLEQVKMQGAEIPTVYILPYLLPFDGEALEKLTAADGVSVEISALDHRLYQKIRREEKILLVWTVNHLQTMAKLFLYPVDGVITDEPLLMKERFS